MKKFVAISVAVLFLCVFVGSAFADNIGFIDVAKVFKGYKATSSAEEQLKKERDDYEKEFKSAQEKLDKAQKENKSTAEVESMRKDLEDKLDPKKKALLDLNEQLTTKLQLEIVTSVKKVAKKVGIDIVLDKQAIITGGVDLTEMVINDLNKK
jgi:outer membrane protein